MVGTSPDETLVSVVPKIVAVTVTIEAVPMFVGGTTVVMVEVSVCTDGDVLTSVFVTAIGMVVVIVSTP
jgi:hypothetical protein